MIELPWQSLSNSKGCLILLAILIIFSPIKTIKALSPDWTSVPKSPYGKQFWDKNSVQKTKMVL